MADEELRQRREQSLWRLLVRANETHASEVTALIHAGGFPEMQAGWPRVLGFLDTEGTRLGVIARRARMSPQAAGQMVDDIARHGFVERVRDPSDRRAVLVRFTPRGRAMLETAVRAMRQVEADYAVRVGPERYAAFKEALALVVAAIDPEGSLRPVAVESSAQQRG